MKAVSLSRRLAVLESKQSKGEPPLFRLLWYDDPDYGVYPSRIKLRWYDKRSDELETNHDKRLKMLGFPYFSRNNAWASSCKPISFYVIE